MIKSMKVVLIQCHKDGSQTAYFRGRKLRGRVVQLPAKYQGT